MIYLRRKIDVYLREWKEDRKRIHLIIRLISYTVALYLSVIDPQQRAAANHVKSPVNLKKLLSGSGRKTGIESP